MSSSIRILLVMSCLLALLAPVAVNADPPAPFVREYGPGGLAPILWADSLTPAPALTQAAGAPAAAAAPTEAQPVENWSRVAFQTGRNGSWDIYSMRLDGTDVRPVTSGPASDGSPRQSPADGRVAFISDRTGNWDIFSVAADGSNLRQLTAHPADDREPAWSPDGSRLAFASDRSGTWDVWVMNADGSNVAPLIAGPEADWGPAWSPDGKQIAWVRATGPELGKIWVANIDGSNARSISNELRFLQNLVWSPDSRTIACNEDWYWDYFSDIVTIPVDGSFPGGRLIYWPSEPMMDALLGSYLPDGQSIILSEVRYQVQGDDLFITGAQILRKKTEFGQPPVALPGSGIDMSADWQKSDFIPPYTRFANLPALASTNGLTLTWTGSDQGGSGIVSYDLQYRVESGDWIHVYSEPILQPQWDFAPGTTGPVSFRVRARDAAGNVEPWPSAAEGDGSVTFYKARYYGFIFDIRRTPIPAAQVEGANWPDIPFLSAADGNYEAWSFNDIYTLNAVHPAYGALLDYQAPVDTGFRFDMALPSKTDAVQNGGFEDELAGWQPGSPDVAEWLGGGAGSYIDRHSGLGSLKLGKYSPGAPATYSISQPVAIPPTDAHPTLSFFFRGYLGQVPNDRLAVTVTEQGGTPVDLALHTLETPLWTHAWADLAQWGGQTVTLRLEVRLHGGEPTGSMVIDEVVVGGWHTPRITAVALPPGLTGAIAVTGENFEPGATVRTGETDLATTFVSSTELTATLPAGVGPGLHDLWVVNPGGEEALATIRLGLPTFLPVIAR